MYVKIWDFKYGEVCNDIRWGENGFKLNWKIKNKYGFENW